MPTLCEIGGIEAPRDADGISFYPELLGEIQNRHDYLYWEFHERGGKQAVLMGKWKGVRLNLLVEGGDQSIELYNLEQDIGEENNIAGQYPEIVDQIITIMENARYDSELFPFPMI
jgi:arylsulfatase